MHIYKYKSVRSVITYIDLFITDFGNCPELTVRLQREGEITPSATVVMQFSSLYPEQPPMISCQCQDRSLSRQLVTCLTELGKQLQGSPMVSEILNQAQEILDQLRSVGGRCDVYMVSKIPFFNCGLLVSPIPSNKHPQE